MAGANDLQPRAIWARHHFESDCSSRTSLVLSLISFQEYCISLLSLNREQTANRKKYVSFIFDGTRWIFPAPLIRFRRISLSSLDPCKSWQNYFYLFLSLSTRDLPKTICYNIVEVIRLFWKILDIVIDLPSSESKPVPWELHPRSRNEDRRVLKPRIRALERCASWCAFEGSRLRTASTRTKVSEPEICVRVEFANAVTKYTSTD